MLKLCKFSLFESKSTQDLVNDADQNPEEACISRHQTWHRKGRGDTIVAQLTCYGYNRCQKKFYVKRTKLNDSEKQGEGINCLLCEARTMLPFKKQKKELLRIL